MTERYLQRRGDVQREQAKLPGLCEKALAEQRKCFRWSQIDEALELALEPAAHALATDQAAAGDAQAQEALQRADALDGALVSEVRRIRTIPRKSPAPVETDAPTVVREVRFALAAHRERGDAFDTAWSSTVGLLQPDKGAVGIWRLALQSTRGSWKAAYEGADGHQGADQVAALEGLDHHDQWAETTFEQVA